jgi:2'-hydroxyisoflavone reductase
MKLLVLGGTVFLGRHLVEAALASGHHVTLFNRGRHNPNLFPGIEKLRGERDGGLAPLRGRRWDAVIDTSGHVPRVVGASASLLSSAVEHYTFVSTLGVYAGLRTVPGLDEDAPVATLPEPATPGLSAETMGPFKALCERAVQSAMPGRVLVVRAGLLVGPYDPTDRFTYWPRRISRGGEVLAPGPPDLRVQLIDARDLVHWILAAVEARRTGVYNVTGPAEPLRMAQVLETCRTAIRSDALFTWVDEGFIASACDQPMLDFPLWVPSTFGSTAAVDCRRAAAAGLKLRPLADTVRATFAWDASRPAGEPARAGLTRERETQLLQTWRQRGN